MTRMIDRIFPDPPLVPVGWASPWLIRRGASRGLLGTHGQTTDPVSARAGTHGGAA